MASINSGEIPNGVHTHGTVSNGLTPLSLRTTDTVDPLLNGNVKIAEASLTPKLNGTNNISTPATTKPEPIAIVGYSCRAPGDVSNPDQLWELCSRARSGWSTIPEKRFNHEAYYHPHPGKVGCANPQGGYFLSQDVGVFDAPFFNITALEATSLDPQQRILLECTFEALESAGVPKESLIGSDTGVFVGGSFPDYELNNLRDMDTAPMFGATGCAPAMLSNRISYYFDFRGPSFTADTACSSSLVALHQAMQSLRSGESKHAIVAGCHLNLLPDYFVHMSTSQLMGETGKTFAFDHRALGGFGRGEGAACLIIKPLKQAIQDNDAIRAVIVNSGINQDGRTNGITVPNGQAQRDLIRKVYSGASINPSDCAFAEMHGTGTKVGDPIEATAVHEALGIGRTARMPLYIGSIKTNIGHLEGASGLMSVIKAAQMLEKNLILPNTNFEKANANIPLADWNMKVPTSVRPWPRGKKYVSVSNYGFGGANAHTVLERAPTGAKMTLGAGGDGIHDPRWRLFVLSAHDQDSLKARMNDITIYLEQRPEVFEKTLARNFAYTLCQRRSHLTYRVAIPATSSDDLGTRLASYKTPAIRASGEPRIGFVFTGQGAQWAKMGMDLMSEYPIFEQAMTEADGCLKRLGADFSLLEELRKDPESSQVNKAHISQPACTAVQIALTLLLKSWGIKPIAVTGHSSGSIAAAFAAGILEAESAMALAYYRGKATVSLKSRFPKLKGSMLAVGSSAGIIRPLIKNLKSGYATVACINSPASITVSGDESAIDELQPLIQEKSIFNRKLKVDQAYHSEHMGRVAEEYLEAIKDIQPLGDSKATYYSSLHGRVAQPSELQPSYWVANLTSPVLFADSTKEMCSALEESTPAINMLLEIGPHAALAGPVKDILKAMGDQGKKITYVGGPIARDQDGAETALQLAGSLFSRGCKVDFLAINFPIADSRPPVTLTDLPTYHWNHSKRYWHETRISKNHLYPRFGRNDILGRIANYSNDLEPTWRNHIRLDDMPWLRHHKMQDMVVFPMSGYLSMAVQAASQRAKMREVPYDRFEFREVVVNRALVLEESAEAEVTITLRPYTEGTRAYSSVWDEFRICSHDGKRGWVEHCRGHVAVRKSDKEKNTVDGSREADNSKAQLSQRIVSVKNAAKDLVNIADMYDQLLANGVQYGPTFQGFRNAKGSESCSWIEVFSPDTRSTMPHQYETGIIIHPALLDIVIQSLWPTFGAGRGGIDTYYMPTSINSLFISRSVPQNLHVHCIKEPTINLHAPTKFDIFATAVQNPREMLISYEGLTMTPLRDVDTSAVKLRELCYKLEWQALEQATPAELLSNGDAVHVNGVKGNIANEGEEAAMNGMESPKGAAVDAEHIKKGFGDEVVIVHFADNQKTFAPALQDALRDLTQKKPTIGSLSQVDPAGKLLVILELDQAVLDDVSEATFTLLQKALKTATGVLWVLTGVKSSMTVGFTRSIRSETMAKIATLDLDLKTLEQPVAAADTVSKVFDKVFVSPSTDSDVDKEYTTRAGEVLVPRIVNDAEMNTFIQRETQNAEPHNQPFEQPGRRLKLTIGMHGALDTLHFVDDPSTSLAPDEVELEVKATGMNFKDVVIAMGQVQSPYIGVESSGIVTSIGSNVTGLQVGQRIMAMTEGAYSTYARCKETSAYPIGDDMKFEDAATIPVIFCTAYYGLMTLAQLEERESVLIHAAAGGVGQAAIMLAKMVGAEIYATCGSADKKKFLIDTYSIPEDHIFYSRDTSFGVPLRRATKGKGVDVVINSLAGDVLRETWDCLAHFGRFIEIGKRDIVGNTRLEMARFEHNAMFASVDLTVVAAERPKLMRKLMANVCELLQKGTIRPIQPVTVYKISEVEVAIRVLQSGKNKGKLVVVPQPGDEVKATPLRSRSDLLKSDGSYIIIGGTGGLGRSMARWMSTKGAKHIVLVSRTGQVNEKIQQLTQDLQSEGTSIHVFPCDVVKRDSVERLINEGMKELPPVRGVVHAAMVLRDVLFDQMTHDQFTDVVKSKVTGAWNLHHVLADSSLDFFIALSSVAGIVGNRGQAAYAAANVFLDAFCQYRNARELPATSIDLTAVADVGYLAENAARQAEVSQNLGGEMLRETEVLALLAAAIGGQAKQFCNNHCITGLKLAPATVHSTFWANDAKFSQLKAAALAELEGQADGSDPASIPLPQKLKTAPDREAALQALYDALVTKLSAVLMIPVEAMDKDQSITSFGLDSLAAIEVRNWITREVEANMQVLEILTSSSLIALARTMLGKSKLVEKMPEAPKEE